MKTIKSKLLVAMVSMVLVVCLGMSIVACIAGTLAIGDNIQRDIKAMAEQTATTVNLSITNRMNMLKNIYTDDLAEGITKDAQKGLIELSKEAEKIGAVRLGVCGTQGMIIFSDGSIADISGEEYFQVTMSGEEVISEPKPSVVDGQNVIVYAIPIIRDGKITGAFVEESEGSELSSLVNSGHFGKTGAGFVINKDGAFIGHSNQSYVEESYNPIEEGKEDTLIAVMKTMQEGKTGSGQYVYQGQKTNAGYAPIEGTDWTLAVTMEHEEIYGSLVILFKQLIMCGLLFFAISALVAFLIGKSMGNRVKAISMHLEKVSDGDLTGVITGKVVSQKDEIGQMTRALQQMKESVSSVVSTIKGSANSLSDKSSELSVSSDEITKLSDTIAYSIDEIAQGTTLQTSELIAITSILEQFNSKLQEMTSEIQEVDEISRKIDTMAEQSSEELRAMSQSINGMQKTFNVFKGSIQTLDGNISEIHNITKLITDVANQTNLLALNASIEAARAGEAGKGFAVVAQEIGSLADQSKDSTASITSLIGNISGNAQEIVTDANAMGSELAQQIEIVNRSIQTFHSIVNEIGEVIPMVQKVKESGDAINEDKNTILRKIDEITSASEEISASSEEISASTQEMNASITSVADSAKILNDMTEGMLSEVNQFTIEEKEMNN